MTKQSEHLSNAQIENYGNRTSGAGPDANQPDEALRINAHLESCPSCRSHLLDFHRASFGLLADPQQLADVQVNTAPTPECPSADALRQLAAGLSVDDTAATLTEQTAIATSDAFSTKLLQHAANCNHCGPLLRAFTEDFSDDFTPEEQAALADLKSSSTAWQKDTAREMLAVSRAGAASSAEDSNAAAARTTEAAGRTRTAATVRSDRSDEKSSAGRPVSSALGRKPFFWKWVLIPATAAIVAIAAFSVWYTQRDTPEKVEKLLAQSYTEQRTTEMRWPGAPWGEPKETLGQATLKQSRTLLAAKDAIQRQTPETLRRTEWVHLKAQSEILSGIPSKQIIDDLTKATQSQPSQSVLFDLAIANFRMGEVADDRSYYLRAKTVLDEMLASFPPSSAALFDRAVAEERLQLRDQAVADLTRCLTLESDPAWSGEIQEKIKKLESLR